MKLPRSIEHPKSIMRPASPPAMKLLRTLAGLCVFALAALPAVAQHGGGSGGGSHGGSGGGSHGGGGHSYGGGSGGSHASSSGGRSYGGVVSAHGSSESSYATGRAGGYGETRGSSESYTYPGTGTRFTGGSATGFTNHGGIRFSDFGVEETPRFTASMLPSRPAATASRSGYQAGAINPQSENERREWTSHARFDRGDHGFRRFPHYGLFIFGAYGAPFCDSLGWAAYDQSFLNENAFGCFGDEWLSENVIAPDADSDQPSEYEDSAADDDATASPDDAAAPDAIAAQSEDAAPQVTLLQLKDGSMYGLTAYWVDGSELHYVTNYGGANSIPLDRIDLAKTVQLNASRTQAFVLQEKPATSKATR
jgi:hypothetical protein